MAESGTDGMTSIGLDQIAQELERMRVAAGVVSFAELTKRIQQRRETLGLRPAEARVARSTVYDAFREGRRRVDSGLVAEIVTALGGTEDDAERLRRASESAMARPLSSGHPAPSQHPVSVPAVAGFKVALLVACVFVNMFGHVAVGRLDLPLYLDMSGTALAALAFGPWAAVGVGLGTNVLAAVTDDGFVSMWFGIVNVVGALLWGYGFHRWRMGTSVPRYVLLNVLVGFACTVAAVPIVMFAFGGYTGHPSSEITAGLVAVGEQLWGAVFSSNLVTQVVDKLIAGGIAFAVYTLLARRGLPVLPAPRRTTAPHAGAGSRHP